MFKCNCTNTDATTDSHAQGMRDKKPVRVYHRNVHLARKVHTVFPVCSVNIVLIHFSHCNKHNVKSTDWNLGKCTGEDCLHSLKMIYRFKLFCYWVCIFNSISLQIVSILQGGNLYELVWCELYKNRRYNYLEKKLQYWSPSLNFTSTKANPL